MSEGEISAKCRICGRENVFVTIQIKTIISGEEKTYFLHYCCNCWEGSLGEYILDQLKHDQEN